MDFGHYLGIPYKDNGRSAEGADCYGLVWLIYRNELGIDLPSHSEKYVTAADIKATDALIANEKEEWDEIPEAEACAFDCVLMTMAGVERHIAMVTRPGSILHVSSGRSSHIEKISSLNIRRRVKSFWRHQRKLP